MVYDSPGVSYNTPGILYDQGAAPNRGGAAGGLPLDTERQAAEAIRRPRRRKRETEEAEALAILTLLLE